jgi:predicted RNase H-like HicB family nuclease
MFMKGRYLVVYEPGECNWGAWAPEVPGCIATGKDRAEVEQNMAESLALHLAWMERDGDPLPEPESDNSVAGFLVIDTSSVHSSPVPA